MPYSFLGHIGFFDQANVYEVLNDGRPNAVAYNTLANFKQRAYNGYWGAASPKIPDYFVNGCFNEFCGSSSYQTVNARWSMLLRAYQVRGIGAEYTYLAQWIPAMPRTSTSSSRQGTYRYDTYLLDIYEGLYANIADANGVHINIAALPSNSPLRRWSISGKD